MSTRSQIIEQIRRAIYNGQPPSNATITIGLTNQTLSQGAAFAAQQNYKGSSQLESVSYINNSFFTTYKNLSITRDEQFLYKVQLPVIPIGAGQIEGVSTCQFKNTASNVSIPCVLLSQKQKSFAGQMRDIPNRVVAYPEGQFIFATTTLTLSTGYTATVCMVSSGDSTNLDSVLNVPDDYMGGIIDYCVKTLMQEHAQKKDLVADGIDLP